MRKKYENQETAVGVLFFLSCAYFIIEVFLAIPYRAPELWPIIPMIIAIIWFIIIEFLRAQDG